VQLCAGISLSVTSLINIGDRLLVIFDGHCAFCNRSVRWLLAHDRNDRLRFAPSESPKLAALLARHGFQAPAEAAALGTILAVRNTGAAAETVLGHSDAVLALLHELPQPWPGIGSALGWIPRTVRDLGYRLIARSRNHIWGRLESCPVPTPEERERFL